MRFVVIVDDKEWLMRRVFGPYRSFKTASGDAKAWNGTVEPLESTNAPEPWNPNRQSGNNPE